MAPLAFQVTVVKRFSPNEPRASLNQEPHRFCVAPMMDWTDRHCRVFHRLMTRHALLYTEMVTAPAVIHGDRARLLALSPAEHPVALQLGGADPQALAEAAAIGAGLRLRRDQPQRRLSVGPGAGGPLRRLPDGRARPGRRLRRRHAGARRACRSRSSAASASTTQDDEADLQRFVDDGGGAGCRTFIVHARKAWLQGLSPKQNREVPAARLRARLSPQGVASRSHDRHQRRHRRPRRRATRTWRTSTA